MNISDNQHRDNDLIQIIMYAEFGANINNTIHNDAGRHYYQTQLYNTLDYNHWKRLT